MTRPPVSPGSSPGSPGVLPLREYYAQLLPPAAPEQEWGISVQLLPPGERHGPVTIGEIFTTDDEKRGDLQRRFQDGEMRILNPEERIRFGEEGLLELSARRVVTGEEYAAEFKEGRVPELSPAGRWSTAYWLIPDHEARASGVATVFLHAAQSFLIEQALKELSDSTLERLYDDPAFAKQGLWLEPKAPYLSGVTQVFEFSCLGKAIRLYNFTATQVGEEQLKQLTNAIRAIAQHSGGGVMPQVMGVFPDAESQVIGDSAANDEARKFWGEYWKAWGEESDCVANAYTHSRAGCIEFSEEIFRNPVPEPIGPDQAYAVGGGYLELVAVHELGHLAIAALGRGAFERYGWASLAVPDSVSQYAEDFRIIKPDEGDAERIAALHAGGDWARLVSDAGVLATAAIWSELHAGQDGPEVHCVELDPRNIMRGERPRLRQPVAIRLRVAYEVLHKGAERP